ncbi:MAG: TonB-dependent receptor plug domain-containing protein [Saprospiraceae bacterium]|nr:TonB-dependent receptor plug domain-containing protein [Saprospiraceae bacterium]
MRLFFILLINIFPLMLVGQNVKGVVSDNAGNPIDFVLITVNSSLIHTHSDESGRYTLPDIRQGDTIYFSHILFETKVLLVGPNTFTETARTKMSPKKFLLQEVTITNQSQPLKTLSLIDLETNPVNSSQELLRHIPGLIIGQHAGGGKAEQIFLRGFDIDHGTDVHISVDGMPVNLVSHAHGQGYADMHFIMPEIIENISYGKGPYDTQVGNFATAGFVALKTKDNPEHSFFSAEYGSFNTKRMAGLFNLISSQKESAYIASEYVMSDGPFETSQDLTRLNIFLKYTKKLENNDKFSIWASRFSSRWDASGQIPQRAVKSGLINRFGAIDDTEGGNTSRTNFVLTHTKYLNRNNFIKSKAYTSVADFLLYSNFTFFLYDSINGDQIKQKEQRNLYGVETELNYNFDRVSDDLWFRVGSGMRYDDVNDVELSSTLQRKNILRSLALGQVDESNTYFYSDVTFHYGNFRINSGIRFDYFRFLYENNLNELYDIRKADNTAFSPKLNLQYTFNTKTQLFLKFGKGFHSNDTRVVIDQEAKQTLPSAYGVDLGGIFKPIKQVIIHGALWYLHLEQEFVYVGDGGIVEPSGKSRRQGVDIGIRYQPDARIFLYTDINIADPRSIDDPEGQNFIPLAPVLTNTGGVSFHLTKNLNGGMRYRHVADRPANEDNSIVATGYTVIDCNINYNFKKINIGIEINNLLNTKWNETQFATESRLKNELNPVEEIHFTPGAPFFVKGKVSYLF